MNPFLLLCVFAVGCLGDLVDELDFAKSTRDFRETKLLLENRLKNVKPEFKTKELHYLVLLGTLYRTAMLGTLPCPTKPSKASLIERLNKDVPLLLEKPQLMAKDLLLLTRLTEEKLLRLLKEVHELCSDVPDAECNKLMRNSVRNNPALLKLLPLLKAAGLSSRNYLDVEPRLHEVALKRGELPYLLSNLEKAVESSLLLLDLLKKLRLRDTAMPNMDSMMMECPDCA